MFWIRWCNFIISSYSNKNCFWIRNPKNRLSSKALFWCIGGRSAMYCTQWEQDSGAREFKGRHFLYHLARRWSEGKFWSRTALSSTGICVEMKRRTTPLNPFVIDNSTLWYADTLALWLTYETYASIVDTVFCRAGHQQRHSGVPYPCNERQNDPALQFRVFQTEVVHFLRPLSFANFMDVVCFPLRLWPLVFSRWLACHFARVSSSGL